MQLPSPVLQFVIPTARHNSVESAKMSIFLERQTTGLPFLEMARCGGVWPENA
jgi:hypothetical protein